MKRWNDGVTEQGKAGSLLRRWRKLYYRNDLELGRASAVAAICVGAGVIARLLLGLFGPTLAFVTFFPAVLISTLIGGWVAGLLSIPLSIASVWWLIQPLQAIDAAATSAPNLVLFVLSGLLVVGVAQFHRRIVFDLEELEQERGLLAREILHRSKNQAAIIVSVVRRSVSDKAEAERLIGRITAIADSDNLLSPVGAPPLELHALLEKVVRPLQGEQIRLAGSPIVLTDEQARGLSLAFHEMMTNASKYGGLSTSAGRVEISWTGGADGCRIVWQESCEAAPLPPIGEGFGLKLITSVLDQLHARLTVDRRPGGYRYEIVLPS